MRLWQQQYLELFNISSTRAWFTRHTNHTVAFVVTLYITHMIMSYCNTFLLWYTENRVMVVAEYSFIWCTTQQNNIFYLLISTQLLLIRSETVSMLMLAFSLIHCCRSLTLLLSFFNIVQTARSVRSEGYTSLFLEENEKWLPPQKQPDSITLVVGPLLPLLLVFAGGYTEN